MSVLAIEGVSLALGGNPVLHEVSFAFAQGRVTALLGPNGAGKSSLLSCVAGLRRRDAGRVTLDGSGVMALDRRERGRRVGLVPQDGDVHWNMASLGAGEPEFRKALDQFELAKSVFASFGAAGIVELMDNKIGVVNNQIAKAKQ